MMAGLVRQSAVDGSAFCVIQRLPFEGENERGPWCRLDTDVSWRSITRPGLSQLSASRIAILAYEASITAEEAIAWLTA